MPNPKLGSVTNDVAAAVDNAKKGQVEIKADKYGIIHTSVGRASFDEKKLKNNFDTVYSTIKSSKPSGVKGTYIKKLSLGSTMGPSVGVSLLSLVEQK